MPLQKLAPEYIRPKDNPEHDQQIWSPEWKCYACHDYGMVTAPLVKMVIPSFDHFHCKQVLCRNPGCEAGKALDSSPAMKDQLDRRFTPETCAELDEIEFQGWKKIIKQQHEEAKKRAERKKRRKKAKMRIRKRVRVSGKSPRKRRRLRVAKNQNLSVVNTIASLTDKLTMPGTKPRTENEQRETDQRAVEEQAKLDGELPF